MKIKKTNKKNKMRKATSFIIILLFIATAFFIFRHSKSVMAAANSTVYFSPATVSVNNGSTFALDARLNPGTNQVIGVELHISYDPSRVHITSFTKNNSALGAEIIAPIYDNSTGKAEMTYFTSFSATPPIITTDSSVATINFQAVGEGSSNISYDASTVVSDLNDSNNVVQTRTPVQVTVGTATKTYTITDFTNIATHWLQNVTGEVNGDYNADGKANSRDMGIVMHSWAQ